MDEGVFGCRGKRGRALRVPCGCILARGIDGLTHFHARYAPLRASLRRAEGMRLSRFPALAPQRDPRLGGRAGLLSVVPAGTLDNQRAALQMTWQGTSQSNGRYSPRPQFY